jgi:hypothetical protein
MPPKTTLYVRNYRPNRLVLPKRATGDVRVTLEYRGHRGDTAALDASARNDPVIARWLGDGRLEEISQTAFNTLAKRQIDQTRPDDTLRAAGQKIWNMPMTPEDHRRPYQIKDSDFRPSPSLEYAGEVISTDEEIAILESMGHFDKQKALYPSKHRD